MSKQLEIITKKAIPLVEAARELVISTEADMTKASEIRTQFKDWLKASEEDRKAITQPILDGVEKVREKYRPTEIQLNAGISIINKAMSDYQTEADRKAQEEADRIASRVKEGKGNLSPETAARKIDEIAKPAAIVVATNGSTKFRNDYYITVIDVSKIPREYMTVDEDKVLKALRDGIAVDGVKLGIKKTPVSGRR